MTPCDCFTEVERLHRFFSDWFVGRVGLETFDECASALAPGFTMVMPNGGMADRGPMIAAIRDQHGTRDEGFAIEVVPLDCRRFRDVHITRYEEHHLGPRPSRRLSTAVITESVDGFQWHAVHETWYESAPIPHR